MTAEEALEIVKGKYGELADIEMCKKCDVTNNRECAECIDKAFDMATEALAKQIPKHVTEMVEDGAFICQSCHSSVPYWASYCPECGQRLE